MQDTTLFETILGLQAPWHVARVELDPTGERVDLWVEHAVGVPWTCSACAHTGPGHDHAEERVWRHLDTCQYQTFLHARIPRIQCPTHGVRQVRVPWAEARSRFTLLLERLVIDLIQQCSTVTGACRIARLTWDEVWGIMQRAVARGQARHIAVPTPYVGVDEKAFRKGHAYHTIVCDLERRTVVFVAEGRTTDSLAEYYASLTAAQRDGLQAVAMDMWPAYIRATTEGLPDGAEKIVFDRFHIMRAVTDAVDRVRKAEHRAFLRAGEASPLTRTKYTWLKNEEHLTPKQADALALLHTHGLQVSRAWALKETLRALWSYRRRHAAAHFFDRWYAWAIRSRLEPMKAAARMIKRHLDGVLRYAQHPITNGVAEGINSKIMSIKRKAGGFRNAEHFTTAIYFHCGGLDLYPR